MNAIGRRARVLVLGVALAASANSLRNGFVYDDVHVVVEDARLHVLNPAAIFTSQYWPPEVGNDPLYRPVTSLSLAIDWRLGGGKPLLFHTVNVALHVAVVALVLALASLVLPPAAAVVAALLFAVHPVHAEAVANVVGRAELLAAVGYLAAVLAFVRYGTRERGGVAGPAIVFAASAIAVGAKEHALTLPAALLLVDAAIALANHERPASRLRRSWPLWAAALLACGLYLWLRSRAVSAELAPGLVAPGLEGTTAAQRFIVMLPAYALWARLMLLPVVLSADYSPNVLQPTLTPGLGHLAGLALLAGAVVLAWRLRRRVPAVTLGLMWFATTAAVAANVVVPTGVLAAERTLYLPSVGAAVALAGLWSLVAGGPRLWWVTATALALLAVRTVERNTLWRDNESFFPRLAREAPASYRMHAVRGWWEFRRGNVAEAERLYRAALAIQPLDPAVLAELGSWYLRFGLYAPADRYLTLALRVDSTRSGAAERAIIARTEAGAVDSAVALARIAMRRWSRRPGVLLASMRALQHAGAVDEAAALAPALVSADSGAWTYLQVAGDALARAGACDSARALVGRAAALAPSGEAAPARLLDRIGTGNDCAGRLQ